ncbi:phage tail protein [Providencia rettgeri]|uniref:phage tail-collar fiber domain-containing protein n=1 Tax=Providencia rettgeri TaxID=587 RepID=UPI002551DB7B|nr:phage tail protein [Providencia rettgeri]MDK7744800.1 phage tail protein [Providencia rettgeri]MDK7759730.1 phage tail protein [Providencia rettgeri]
MASVITVAFENWKAQEAASGNAVLLDEFVFANVPNLDPTKPIDRNEKLPTANQIVHRQAVNKAGLASENAVAYSVTMGADVGNFDFNWIGLLNKASGTVAMITHAPTQKKLKNQNGQQGNVLTRSFILEFQGAAEETQIKTSAETWQIDFTARLSGIDEMQRLINVDSYGAAAFFNDGFEVTRSGEQYTVKKGLGYVGGLRGELAQNQILNGLRNTKVYADFSYQGNIVSQWNTVVKTTSAATLNNYVDAAGFTHQVFAIASIDASGNVKDLRPMGGLNSQEINALETRFKLDLSKKIDKANITSQTGNSTELVVNQHLLTTELGKKQPVGNYAPAGDYATNTALNSGLALKFDKTGGVVSGDISATGDISSTAGKAIVKLETKGEKTTLVSNLGNGYRAHILQDKSGTLAHHGDFGIGTSMNGMGMTNIHDANTFNDTGCVASGADSINFFANLSPLFSMIRNGGSDGTGFVTQIQGDGKTRIAFRQRERGTWRGWYEFLTEANTTKDTNGFVRTGTATAVITSDITQTTGSYSNKVMSQEATTNAINAIKILGNGQKWTDVKSERQSGVNYTNSTGRTIVISATTIAGNVASSLVIYVDGVMCSSYYVGGNNSDFTRQSIGSAIIPAGSTYRVDATSIGIWAELR